jgi:hypothetical protein
VQSTNPPNHTLTQNFGENEDENHSHEKSRLLCSTPNTSVSNDANCEPCSQTGQSDTQSCPELDEASVQRQSLFKPIGNQDRYDETVDTDDTSHDNWDDVCCLVSINTLEYGAFQPTLDNQIRPENTHGADTDTRFCGSVSSTKACEHDGGGTAHSTKEWLHINQYDGFDVMLSSDSLVLHHEVVEGALRLRGYEPRTPG